MIDIWEYYFFMWRKMDFTTALRWGWFIFILDFPRFFLIEGMVLYWSRFERKKTKEKWAKAHEELLKEMPLVTILVPGHNEGKHLYKLINSMSKQTYPNKEIIVVDDGSTDNTALIARNFEKNKQIDFFISLEERGGKASAANIGLRYAKGKYIIHIDADSSLDYDAVEKILIPFYRYKNVGGVGGNLIVRNQDQSLTTTMQYLEYLQSISISRIVLSKLRIYKIISGAFGAFPKTVLDRVGGWDIGPGLDGDITVKIRKINFTVLFEEEAVCRTHVPITWKALSKQRLRWSRSLVRFRLRKHRDIWLPTQNFKILNFLSFFENVFFSLVLDIFWLLYIIIIIITEPTFLLLWFPFKYSVYFLIALGQYFFIISVYSEKKEVLSKIIYVPLYPIYMGYYMRIIRTISYIDELFFYDSYKDTWNPLKTSKKAKQHGM